MKTILATLLLSAALAAPAGALERDDPDTQLAKLLEGRVAGAPVTCINASAATSTQIVEGKAIVYGIGSTLYVNRPRGGGSALRDDDILVTRQYGSQLCRMDNVRLLDRNVRVPRGFVVLDSFV